MIEKVRKEAPEMERNLHASRVKTRWHGVMVRIRRFRGCLQNWYHPDFLSGILMLEADTQQYK